MRDRDRKTPRHKETGADRLVAPAEDIPDNKTGVSLAGRVVDLERRILRERFWWISGLLFLFCFHVPIHFQKTGYWTGWLFFFLPVLTLCWSICAYYCGMPKAAEIISKQGHRISTFLTKLFRN